LPETDAVIAGNPAVKLLVLMTKQLQLLFTLVFGDLFTPFLFQTAHFSSLIFLLCAKSAFI